MPHHRTRLAVLGGLLVLAACAVGPDYKPPEIAVNDTFARARAADAAEAFAGGDVVTEWWRALDAPVLHELLGLARDGSLDLRIAEANLRAARALLGLERKNRSPTATARASVDRSESSEAQLPAGIDRRETLYAAGLDASWELDLFGRVRRAVEAGAAEYEAADADRRGVIVAVSAEVCRAYVELAGTRRRIEVARANVANQEESLRLVEALLAAGRGTELDIERARAQLESTRALVPLLRIDETRAMQRLAVLVGKPPAALDDLLSPVVELPAVPNRIAIGDPASLLRRRPDVAAAEARLAAATARIGVAVADLFPRLSLSGSFGALSTSLGDLTDEGARTTSFGPFLKWAAFDLGRVRDRIRAEEARADAALARYERTVLITLEETENALVRLDQVRRRQLHLLRAEAAAAGAAELARQRYGAGLDSFLAVLDAESRLLAAQDDRARSGIDTADAFVGLYVALGGGW